MYGESSFVTTMTEKKGGRYEFLICADVRTPGRFK
jgi:hypothetical protein